MQAGEWAGRSWSIGVSEDGTVDISWGRSRLTIPPDRVRDVVVRRHVVVHRVHTRDGTTGNVFLLPGDVRTIRQLLSAAAASEVLDAVCRWADRCRRVLRDSSSEGRWLSRDTIADLESSRPDGFGQFVSDRALRHLLSREEQAAVDLAASDLAARAAELNPSIAEGELVARRALFDSIESSPLTEEQARAVACMDNRVQVVAAAGSGKTSVLVARAVYAASRRFVAPNRILLLAFNRAAATELRARVQARFESQGVDGTGVSASTFHAFGLEVIARARGSKPRVAAWVENGTEEDEVLDIVETLSEDDTEFRRQWDLWRLLDLKASDINDDPSADDVEEVRTPDGRFVTYSGIPVRSAGERMIADFLHLHGVAFEYERDHPAFVPDAEHRQYRPDFFYPDIDTWHEHWAVRLDGTVPPDFDGYAESMQWKKEFHQTHGTGLIETTWADVVVRRTGLDHLREELERRGVSFVFDPSRATPQPGAHVPEDRRLAALMLTFLSHVKANGLDRDQLDDRVAAAGRSERTRRFLRLFWPIADEWERRLRATSTVDFNDMLLEAARLLESGEVDMGFELVCVDEFQDASVARARLTRALVDRPHRYLLAVGDDWQSINRFAGADLSVMTNFEDWFGPHERHDLTTTFRCTQAVADVSAEFVQANPAQLTKPVTAHIKDRAGQVHVVFTEAPGVDLETKAVGEVLQRIADSEQGPVSVLVLGRYRNQRALVSRRKVGNATIEFKTAHSSKGLEADHVIVVGVVSDIYGFPSTFDDDPVLACAMPSADPFRWSEERRLFYVALTRARRSVFVVTSEEIVSPFASEIAEHPLVERIVLGDGSPRQKCPKCHVGTLMDRKGKYGPFVGCSMFAIRGCQYTRRPNNARNFDLPPDDEPF